MKNLSFFLGWRYLLDSKQEKSISTMVVICFLGVLVGSFALAVVASVMNGFEYVTHKKMQGVHSQIIIQADGQTLDYKRIASVLKKEFPEIQTFSARAEGHALIKDQETGDIHNIVAVKAVDPLHESTISSLEEKIIGEKKLSELLKKNHIIVGKKLAQYADIQTGQPLTLFIAPEDNVRGKKIKLASKPSLISATFKTGIDEFDTGVLFCSLSFFKELFPDSGVTQIGVQLKPNVKEDVIIDRLRDRLGLSVYSWKELYPALVSALKLEKYAMFLILALITLVASMNIISLMFMQITRKRSDIAILKAMGMADKNISQIFLFIGICISLFGSLVGLIFAFVTGFILERYPFISLPDAYYVSHLPCRMNVSIFLAVFLLVIGLSFVSAWFTARRTRKINISQVLRFEG